MKRRFLTLLGLGIAIGLAVWLRPQPAPPVVTSAPVIPLVVEKAPVQPITVSDKAPGAPAFTAPVHSAPIGSPDAVQAFRSWATDYVKAPLADRSAKIEAGVKLAKEHRAAMRGVIPVNPKLALEMAVPMVLRQDLPPRIVSELERRVNTRGELSTIGVLGTPDAPSANLTRIFHARTEPEGENVVAYVYGKRASQRSLGDTRVNGVEVEGHLAVRDTPFRQLEVGERPLPKKAIVDTCPISGISTPLPAQDALALQAIPPGVAVIEDDLVIRVLCAGGHIQAYADVLAAEEETADGAAKMANKTLAEGTAGGGVQPFNVPPGWTTGASTLLYLRVAFPDILQDPRNESETYDILRQITDFYVESSFGRFYLVPTVAPLIVLPHTSQWYIDSRNSNNQPNGYRLVRSHAVEAARKLGYDTSNYDLEIVDYKNGPSRLETGGSFAGLGSVGGKGVWLYNNTAGNVVGIAAHELGHNLGLAHSNYWLPSTNPPTSIGAGSNVEYGNFFDVMGGATSMGHYIAVHKWFIDWLPDNAIHRVQANGTYRLYQIDQGEGDADKRFALRVAKDSERDYWLEFRQRHTTNPVLNNGLMVTWSPWGNFAQTGAVNGSNGGGQLVDMTPGSAPLFNLGNGANPSADTRDDAGLIVGRTFSDTDADVHITPIAKGTSTPPYIDVVVNRGPFPGNRAPTLAIVASNLKPGRDDLVTFTATATDLDGDALAYAWDFGEPTSDATTLGYSVVNAARVTHSFPTRGLYRVTCTASDMKGKRTTRALMVEVSGTSSLIHTISGRVVDAVGLPMEGVLVTNTTPVTDTFTIPNANAIRSAFTDSDGRYVLTNLAEINTTVTAHLFPFGFAATGDNQFNPLDADKVNVDFAAAASLEPSVTITVDDGSMTEGGTDTATITITRHPSITGNLDIQLMDGSSGTASLGVDYDITASPVSGAPTAVQTGGNDVGTSRVRLAAAVTTGPNQAPQVDEVVLTITATADGDDEGIEYAVLEFPNTYPNNSPVPILGPRTIRIPITDLDSSLPVVRLIADDPGVSEGPTPANLDSTATMRLVRNGPTAAALTVDLLYTGAAGSSTQSVAPTSVTIPAGSDSVKFTLSAVDDVIAEGITNGDVSLLGSPFYIVDEIESDASFYILDNDQPVLTIVATDNAATETPGNGGKFTITRAATDISAELTVDFSVGGTALPGQDYRRIQGIAVIPAYETSVDINIDPIDDRIGDGNQTVVLRLGNNDAYAIASPGSASVTIVDNDKPEVSIQSNGVGFRSVQEPSATPTLTTGVFTVTRFPGTGTLNTDLQFSGTATSGADYSSISTNVNFADGETSKSVNVTFLPDSLPEGTETLIASIAPSASYTIGIAGNATVLITDEVAKPTVGISFDDQSTTGDATTSEPDRLRSITITNGGAGYSANPTVTITGGGGTGATATARQTSGAVTSITITNAGSGYTSPPTVTFTGGGAGVTTVATADAVLGRLVRFHITRQNNTSAGLNFTPSPGGTATSGVDYTIPTPTINIPAGSSGGFLDVVINDDNLAEGTETLTMTLVPSGTYSIRTPTATAYISDQEGFTGPTAPSVAFATSTSRVLERQSNGSGIPHTIDVILTGTPLAYPVLVDYAISGGSATGNGVDYTFTNGQLSFASGETSKTLTLTTVPDNVPDGAQTVNIDLFRAQRANLGATSLHTVFITDMAAPEVFTDVAIGTPTVSAEIEGRVYPNITGKVDRIVVTDGGSGYTSAPTVAITGGGGGSGATATAVLTGDVVTSIIVTSAGSGFVTTPTVSFTGTGTGATARAIVGPLNALDGVGNIVVTNGGSGYSDGPSVTITGGGGVGAEAVALVTSGAISGINITKPGSGYTSQPTITITGGNGTGATATTALTAGCVTSASVTAPGSGYTAAPTVSIVGTGTEATAQANVVSGVITSITILNPGKNFTAAPTVTVSGGGGTGATLEAALSPTLVQFEWGTSPTALTSKTVRRNAGLGQNAVTFSDVIADLPTLLAYPGAYYYRAVAQNAYGTTVGITRKLTTSGAPVATTLRDIAHTATSITLAGTVATGRQNVDAWFEWGFTTAYGNTTPVQGVLGTTATQNVNAVITAGLFDGALVHYRLVVRSDVATVFGADLTAAAVSQKVAGDLHVNLNARQATAGTAAWENAGALEQIFVANSAPQLVNNVQGTGIPGVLFDGLDDNYAGPNAPTDITGNDSRTLEVWVYNPGLVTSDDIASIGQDGTLTQSTLSYSATAAFKHGGTGNDVPFAATAFPALGSWHHLVYTYSGSKVAKLYVDGALKLTKTLTANLATTPSTSINLGTVRTAAGALSSGGFHGYLNSFRVHGGELSATDVLFNFNLGPVRQPASAPVVTAKGASSLTATSAALNGIAMDGGSAATAWFEWGTSTAYDNASAPQTVTPGILPTKLTLPVVGLAPNTDYHFRVVAQNAQGTSVTTDQVFNTTSLATAGALWVDLRAADLSGSTAVWPNHGALGALTAVGTPVFQASAAGSGVMGVQFDGSTTAYTSLAADADISFDSDRTIEVWFMNPANGASPEVIVNEGKPRGLAAMLSLHSGSSTGWRDNRSATTVTAPLAAAWHHAVLVYANGTVQTYIDGQLANATNNAPMNQHDDGLVLGAGRDLAGALDLATTGFSGFINAVRVHGGALTAAQVLSNFATGPALGTAGAPTVVTLTPPDLVTAASATLKGAITPAGLPTTAWFEWGTSAGSLTNKTPSVALPNLFSSLALNDGIGGLASGTTYFYRAVAQNTAGTTQGNTESFVATGSVTNLPTATITGTTLITAKGATLNGTATPSGLAANAWFEYGLATSTTRLTTPKVAITATTLSKTMLNAITGLQPGGSYVARLIVENTAGRVVSATQAFTTLNTAPVATASTATTKEDTAVKLALKGTDAEATPLTIVVTTPPANGSLVGNTLTPTYTPTLNFVGTDTFSFKVNDGVADSGIVTCTITVTAGTNDAPIAQAVASSGNEDTAITVTLLATDPENDAITSYQFTQPENGVVSLIAGNQLRYQGDSDFNGTDTFTYTATNAGGVSNSAIVLVTVLPVNDPVTPIGSAFATAKGVVLTAQLQADDPDGDVALVFAKATDPASGSVVVTGTGSFTYTPTSTFVGEVTFDFTVSDGTVSAPETVTIIVGAPTANGATFTGIAGDAITGSLTGTDPNSLPLTFEVVGEPFEGSVVIEPDGSFIYNPDDDTVTEDSFTFTVSNGTDTSVAAEVRVLFAPRPPNWFWVGGANTARKPGTYGTLGSLHSLNNFGGRSGFAMFTTPNGDEFVFGGNGMGNGTTSGALNDVWKRGGDEFWTWVKGANVPNAPSTYGAQGLAAATNTPGGRYDFAWWAAPDGNLWVFGGNSSATNLQNDLWKYDPVTNVWTWLKGSNLPNINGTYGSLGVAGSPNTPGARSGAATWVGADGSLWLFGGNGRPGTGTVAGNLNDLWKYDPATNRWTWIAGPSTLDGNGIFGVVGSSGGIPSARSFAAAWVATDGKFYLFGGSGKGATLATKGHLNDLWSYDPLTNAWTWISGSSAINGVAVPGTQGIRALANVPAARSGSATAADGMGGVYLFGGQGSTGHWNDVWHVNASGWVLVKGPLTPNGVATYGTKGTESPVNTPGARRGSVAYMPSYSGLSVVGGANAANNFNDEWDLQATQQPVARFGPVANVIGSTTATLNGIVFPQTETASAQFSWWPAHDSGAIGAGGITAIPINPAGTPVVENLTGLSPATTYLAQIRVASALGNVQSPIISFTTTGSPAALTVQFASASSVGLEQSGSATVSVQLSGTASSTITVPYTINGLAVATPLTILAGQTGGIITVPLTNNGIDDPAVTLALALTAPTGATLGAQTTHSLSVTDDEVTPTIVTSPVSAFAKVGTSQTFTVVATGSSLTYQWKKNGAVIAGATQPSYTIPAVAATSVGKYICDVKNGLATVPSAEAELFVLDGAPKTVTQTTGNVTFTVNAYMPAGTTIDYVWNVSPTAPRVTGHGTKALTVTGVTAADSFVYVCTVNKTGASALSAVSGNFTLIVPMLAPVITTPQTLRVGVANVPYSETIEVDTSLARTPTSFTVSPALPAGLTLSATGVISGKVAAPVTNLNLNITAKNAGGQATQAFTLNIIGQPADVVGSYVALVDSGLANDQLGARFELTVTTPGTYTAKLITQAATLSTAPANLDVTLNPGNTDVLTAFATASFARAPKPPITVAFTLTRATNVLTGTLTDPLIAGPLAVTGYRNKWSTTVPATNFKDYYNVALPLPDALVGDVDVPQGSGYLSFTVAPAGTLTLAGRTADGLTVTGSTIIGPAGELPVFVPFTTSVGSLVGELDIDDVAPAPFANNTIDGLLTWTKRPAPALSKDMAYRAGFGPIDIAAVGGKHIIANGGVAMGLANVANNAEISFFEGGLLSAEAPPVIFSIRNTTTTTATQTVTVPTSVNLNPGKLTFKFVSAPQGSFSGTFVLPGPTVVLNRTVTYQGVIVHTGGGNYQTAGFFLLPRLPQPGQTLLTSEVLSGGLDLHEAPAP